ncbi:ABC transporter substrate-binding protein [Conexibacter sp. CPCC 206217]|uniref:ABC transporter substrate-binding protein n=1 Tax=Conexibacter sp. CPCC 206217 TaxID=3064574 RepID=UPI00271F1743|nr:ABC transporter substrate-binding protein [Conexibacter sp. CPCC 206217]MDO8211768.1 ABC transporter substrate-binding protein [Conexibacter sp. CPCC 206217]
MRSTTLGRAAGAAAIAAAIAVSGCGGGNGGNSPSADSSGTSTAGGSGGGSASGPTGTLVVDQSFVDRGVDPQRQFTPTNNMLVHAMYDTLVTFEPGKTDPVPDAAASWRGTDDAKSYTFTLNPDVVFSDGTPLTSADVVFSLNRLVNVKGPGAFLLEGVTVSAPDARTVVVRSDRPNPALLRILATPPTSIVNSRLLKANGGSDARDADKSDRAEAFLQKTSAGSGPYTLEQGQQNQQYTLAANPRYWGEDFSGFPKVVVRNMPAPTQLLNVQRGANEIALDLSAQQAQTLEGRSELQVRTDASVNVFDVEANMNESISPTGDENVRRAIRLALDYEGYTRLSGVGAAQAPGVIPSQFLGALPPEDAVRQDLAAARAELAKSGRSGIEVELAFPSDATPNGVSFSSIAQKVKSDLEKIGIDVELKGTPAVTFLADYAAGRNQMSVSYWGPDYPDPNDYLVYAPGAPGTSRAADNRYVRAMNPELAALGARAGSTLDDTERGTLFQEFQRGLNEDSPFMPLFQPAQAIVGSTTLSNVVLDPTYTLNIPAVGSN